MSFYDRYAECCRRKNIAPVSQDAADRLGCTKANISALAKNSTMPRGDVIAGVARMLDVSADFLLGLTDVPRPIQSETEVSEWAREALAVFYDLNHDGQKAALAMLHGLAIDDMFS